MKAHNDHDSQKVHNDHDSHKHHKVHNDHVEHDSHFDLDNLDPLKIAIACGGTGGHFFPGLAVGEELMKRGNEVILIVSRKSIDRKNAEGLGMKVRFLPAVGMIHGAFFSFCWGMFRSLILCLQWFFLWRPNLVLAMGGFTSVAPVLIGRVLGARVYLHESNSIPGRANRCLARICHGIFVGFSEARSHFSHQCIRIVGTPVRQKLKEPLPKGTHISLGLDERIPVLLIVGGSQGSDVLNHLMLKLAPLLVKNLVKKNRQIQFIHLIGSHDQNELQTMYSNLGMNWKIMEFSQNMTELLRVAKAVLSRAGASSLAEYDAVGIPSFLVPYPDAVDQHQMHNARLFCENGGGKWEDESRLNVEKIAADIEEILFDEERRKCIIDKLQTEIHLKAADRIANVLTGISANSSKSNSDSSSYSYSNSKSYSYSDSHLNSDHLISKRSKFEFDQRLVNDFASSLFQDLSTESKFKLDEPLAKKTTLKVGGPAEMFLEPASLSDLQLALKRATEANIPVFILGRGSNLLIRDEGISGLVIALKQSAFSKIKIKGRQLICGAGARLRTIAGQAKKAGISGFEFLEGIPGTLGGALRMNAGAMGSGLFDVVCQVQFVDYQGNLHERSANDLFVEYRACPFLKDHLALKAVLIGKASSEKAVRDQMNLFSLRRRKSQPAAPSAGCIFKNPTAIPAGKLIDELMLKGTRIGGASVSKTHGNFIINEGGATAEDVLQLIEIIKSRARKARGIELKTEVQIVGG